MTISDTEVDLVALERELLVPRTRASEPRLRELLDPEIIVIASTGTVMDLQSTLEMLSDEPTHPSEPLVERPAGYAVRDLGDGVRQVTYETINRLGVRVRRSSIWRRSDRGWRMFFHQGTPVP